MKVLMDEEEYLEKFIFGAFEDPYFIEVVICHDFLNG